MSAAVQPVAALDDMPRLWVSARMLARVVPCLLALSGCAALPDPSPPTGLAELMERPAERALVEGIRAYDEGQYLQSEDALRRALAAGLVSARDRASAHKLLAFITCTSARLAPCEAEFRLALAADPSFTLNRSEAGHPLWGPVYLKTRP